MMNDNLSTEELPRRHHYRMKSVLSLIALKNPDAFFIGFGSKDGLPKLRDAWNDVGAALSESDRLSWDGLAIAKGSKKDEHVLVITLPPPTASHEAFYIAAYRSPKTACRLFLLERGVDPETGAVGACIVEQTMSSRMNWGPFAPIALEQFIIRIGDIAADASAKPDVVMASRP